VRGDWFISDGEIWIFLPTGLVYFTADAVTVSPPIQGTTDVQATLTWLNTNKLNLAGGTMQGQLLLQFPTTDMSAVPWHTLVQQLGGYLALTGGNMLGGISFDGSLATGSSFTDNSRYLSLHPAGYGFNVTNSRLNYNVPADASHIFWVGGIMKFYTNVSGLTMTDGDLTLAHDPTSTMHATTKQYVDGRTPFTTDAPNDQNWYGRHAAQWGYVPGVQYIGAGAYNLNAVSPFGFMGILSITNQASAPNWPSDNPDQTASVLHTYNSNAAWQGQLMMGGRQRGQQPALWYRSYDDAYVGGWSPWTRLIGSTGGTFLATVVFFANNTPGMVPVIVQGNGSAVTPAQNWGGAFQFNQSGGNSELDFINLFNNPGRSFSWWQMNTGGTALTEIGWFSPNGNFSVPTAVYTGSVHLSQTPTASDQAATLGQVNAVSASLGNYLPLVGGILTGNLTLNASWPTISLDTATGNGRQIMGFTSGSARWLLRIGDNDPESGNNLGASFALYRYGDGGGYLGMPFFISRQTGDASFQGTIFVGTDPTQNLAVATKQYVDAVRTALGGYLPLSGGALSGLLTAQAGISVTGGPFTVGWSGAGGAGMVLQAAPGAYRALIWETGGLQLWNIGNSSGEPRDGSNTGGDLAFYRFDDAGNFLSTPLMLMRASGAVMLDRDPSSNLQAATKQYVDSKTAGNYLPLTGGVLSGRLDISYTASTTSCQLFLAPANFSGNALEGKLRFGGTFGVGVGDIGVRLTSSIRSGFRSNAWGYEYLDVWINNGNPNDASSDINQVQVASFNRFGITMPASMAITLSADPTANLQAATKQYVDGIILRQGGPWLPLTGGQISGGLEVQGILEATSNSSVINGLGTWGLAITNNLTQGQGEVDFVSLYTPYGGFHWYQAQTGYVKADLMALYPNATLALWGLGIQYWGIPHGGNTVGFVWYGGWLNAYVDGSLIGFLMTSDTANSLYLALTGGTMQGMLYSNSGINFNNGAVSNPQDTSRGITLWGATSGGYGFCVTGNTLNYNTDVANDKHDFYAGSNLLFRIWGSNYVISNLPMSLQGWLAVGGTSSLGGAVTINAYTPGWGAFNFGQQLAITGPINNGIGICDSSGTKWVGIHNSGGALMFSGMPALTDTTTPPRQWLMLSDAGATVSQITGTQSGGGNSSAIRVVAAFNASYEWNETSAAVDTRKWDAIAGGGSLYFRVMSDDEATANAWLTVGRAGAASTSVYLGTPNGQVYFNNIVGPLHFGNRIAPNNDPANTSNHITLWDGGYGFSITGGTLNVVFGGTCMFLNNGQQQAYFSSSGLTLASGTTALLGRDPTAAMEAVTLQYFQAHGAPSGAYLPIDGSVAMTPGNLRLNAGATPPTARTITGQTAGVDEWCIFLGGMNHAPFAITKFIGTASYQPGISIDWTTLNVTLLGNLAVNKTQGTISVNDPGGAYAQLGAYPGGGTLSVYGSNSQITLANAGSGHVNAIVGYSGTTYQRWSIAMGNATPESGGGSNTGSDFSIARFSDTGVQLGTPFFINRATGNVTIGPGGLISQGTVSINASGYATLALNKGGITSGYSNQIVGYAVGKTRWIIAPGNTDPESTGNAGSNFAIYSYNDDGSYNASPFFINRATGATTVNSNLYAPYISCSGWIIGSNIIRSQGYSNPSVACYNLTGGYVSGMWCESGGTLSWGDCDGNGTPSNTRMYLDRSNNLTVAGGSFATYLHSSGETNTNTIMNASGVFYVANNYAYYLARDGGSGTWNFVENNQWNFAVRINGDIACRNSLYAYGGVFAQNDGGFGFYQNAGAQRQFAFAANWFWDWDGNNGTLYWYSAAFSGAHWYIRNDGWCFNNWFVVGGHGAYQDLSDERAKVDIMPSLAGLAEILQINPIRFRRVRNFKPKPKIDDYHDVGFSAQQVRGIIPEAVMVAGFELPGGGGTMDSANPSLSIGTTAIIAALVNSVKELTAMNAALAARVATLETRTLH
jgi:hypothetical protein